MTQNGFTYVCTKGHVDPAPSMGTYAHCQVLEPVHFNGRVAGAAPCGCAVVKVPHDDVLEAAFRVGGGDAVMVVLKERQSDAVVPPRPGQRF